MTTPAYPSSESLPQASACIEQRPVVDEYARQRVAMLRDRAAGAHNGASGLLEALFADLTPEARAKARLYVADLRDEAEVMRAEGRLADAAANEAKRLQNTQWLNEVRATLKGNEARLFTDRTA